MDFCCIRVSKFGDRWSAATAQAPGEPIDLVELVMQAPEFLGMLTPDQPMPRAAMVAPQSSSNRVLIAVDAAGGVLLVACPDARHEGGNTLVVGDILSTNGRLWNQKYDALARPFQDALGKPLADWVGGRAGAGWSADKFRSGVEASLGRGKFPIVVLVSALDAAAKEMLAYLGNMNMNVRSLGYDLYRGDGVEVIRPRLLEGPRPPESAPVQAPAVAAPTVAKPAAAAPSAPVVPKPAPPRGAFSEQYVPTSSIGKARENEPATEHGEGFPASDATPKQQEILVKLLGLDALGMKRRGFEYFPPKAEGKAALEGSIVIVVDANRWPFPKPEEVIVVVNTGTEYLASYLNISPREIEEFLGSLPRAERKEHKGSLLLRATSVHEATQLVNELRALKEVSFGGYR